MSEPEKVLDSEWHEAIALALDDSQAASKNLLVFFEMRCDLVVEVSSQTGPSSIQTLQCGLSASAGAGGAARDRWIHLSDPAFEDVERLARGTRDQVGAPCPTMRPAEAISAPSCEDTVALEWIERIHREIARLEPKALAKSRWVQFDQRVLVGTCPSGVVEDRRRGCRIRLQVWTEGAQPAIAVSEAVLRPKHHESNVLAGPRPEDTARQAVDRLRRRAHPRKPPTGRRTVVLGPGMGGVLVHEVVGHALEADTAQRGSWLTGSDGIVAAEDLNILDDPRRGRAPWRFDDEGRPSRATPLIGGGRVRSWLTDRATARKCGCEPTGHGRRSSYREPILPRMGCTFVAAGRLDPKEVTDGVSGIYVRRMEAASVDPSSGRATFRVTDSDLLNQGRFEAPLTAHLLSIDARQALSALDRIGNDLTFDTSIGSCQRDGQSLAISVGAPTMRIGPTTVIA